MIPRLLSIAGSDPSGGAGIQADLKTFSALGGYGMSVITGLTAQNTLGVRGVHAVPAAFVRAQMEAVLDDIPVDAVKIGMLANAEIVAAVADVLRQRRPPFVVLDPVMVAKSGDRLLVPEAVAALRTQLLPVVDLITPNLPEAADLLGTDEVKDEASMLAQAQALVALGPAVLLKGGHLVDPESPDLLLAPGAAPLRLTAPRVATVNTHGTGCTLSSAIAALRPLSSSLDETVRSAKAYLTAALQHADRLGVGHGHGPVHHFHGWF